VGVKRAGAVPIVSYQADHSFREGVCQRVTPTIRDLSIKHPSSQFNPDAHLKFDFGQIFIYVL